MESLDDRPIAKAGAVSRLIGDEMVIVLPEHGQVKILNDVAARIWNLIDGEHTLRQIIADVCDYYAVDPKQAQDDVLHFIGTLVEKEMVSMRSA